MRIFEKPGADNTEEALTAAVRAAAERKMDIAVATGTGQTAERLAEVAKAQGFSGHIVAVSCVYGMHEKGKNELSDRMRKELEGRQVRVVTAAHALSGAERGISKVFRGVYPAEIVSAALRMLGQGVKVCVEIALMALDSGNIPYGEPVVCVAGSGGGADTVCIITPDYTADLLQTRIHEILCKPGLYTSCNLDK